MLFPTLMGASRPANRPRQILLALGLSLAAAQSADAADCLSIAAPSAGSTYEIAVDTSTTVRTLQPEFFGFNVEWLEFQWSLWDSANQRVKPGLVDWLKAFPGAVYRYPGGTEANYFEWRKAIGDVATRQTQSPVTWTAPLVAKFGLVEYLDFVKSVGGKAWYVLNLYGTQAGELPSATTAAEAGAVAAYFRQQTFAGKPAILRYELGNELDRNPYLWAPTKYGAVATAAASAVANSDLSARMAAISQDYDAVLQKYGITQTAYNTYLGQTLKGQTTEFTSHRYYDGSPWALPVSHEVRQECYSIAGLTQGLGSAPVMWITENARSPEGTATDPFPQANWPQTENLSAAISISDMLIALSQIPAVQGTMTHALHALGALNAPWPLFHLDSAGNVVPSAVYWGMRTLRESMLGEVLATRVVSANQSGNPGGYDLRAVALADAQRTQFSVWLINRANASVRARLTLPALAGNTIFSGVTTLANSDPTINNYGGVTRISPSKTSLTLVFDANGQTYLNVPANAVMAVSMVKTIASTTPPPTTPTTPTTTTEPTPTPTEPATTTPTTPTSPKVRGQGKTKSR